MRQRQKDRQSARQTDRQIDKPWNLHACLCACSPSSVILFTGLCEGKAQKKNEKNAEHTIHNFGHNSAPAHWQMENSWKCAVGSTKAKAARQANEIA